MFENKVYYNTRVWAEIIKDVFVCKIEFLVHMFLAFN